jgi:SAM-dependent methyltransferase
MSEHERLRRSWIANASAWTDAVREQRIESRRLVTDAAIVDAVLDQHPRTVLDLGCGEGWLARALASHGIEVTGIDASAPLIEAARERGGGTFLVAGYESLPLPQSFDATVANFSLLDDRTGDVLARLVGTVIVQTVHPLAAGEPYADGWRTETFAAFPGKWPESMPWYFRTKESWVNVFESAGFRVIETREPMHPERQVPASLILIGRRVSPFPS